MATIDSRVVQMNFDGSKFGSGVSSTLSALDRLKAALHLGGASQGLKDINAAAGSFNSAPMEQGVGRIGGAFTAMQAVAFGALANIGAKLSSMAMNMANEFTLAPVMAGFQEYELKMGSIQTILANTARHGTTLETVNHELEELNKYADQTIYNFGDMTRNIGKFTNAGIKVEDATAMIKGFSNAAAASGSNAEQAAHAAEQLSQGLSAGKITAQDWISLTNAGMGNKNMQLGLIDIAQAMGTLEKGSETAKSANANFKGSLEEGWLEADVMSTYLKIMAGDMTDAEIAALGLGQESVAMLRQQATMGAEAATKVRTFTQLMGTLKESVGSGWSESFAIIFGDFNEATELFTNMSNSIGGFLGRMSASRNEMLQGWKDAGGRTALIEGLTEAFWALGAPLAQVGMAFRDVFPQTSGARLAEITKAFRDFMVEIQPSHETLDRLRRTFAGFFAILGIGWEVLKAVGGFIGKLFLGLTEGDQGILRITASIGDFLVGLHEAIKTGGGLTKFFDTLLGLIFKIINPIRDAGQALGKIFEGVDIGPLGESLGKFISSILSFGSGADSASDKANGFKEAISGIFEWIGNMASKIADFFEPITSAISDALGSLNFEQINDALQTVALGGIAVFLKQLGGMFSGFSLFQNDNNFFDTIKEGFDNLTGTLSAMQANLKASMLVKIAAAIALLALSVVLLASVDGPGLMRATAALTAMFIQLGVAMAVFQGIGTIASIAKLNLMGSALILLGVAILLLTGAVRMLAKLSWEELGKGLLGLVVIIGGLIAMSQGLDKSRGAIIRSAAALIIMAVALKVLVGVVEELGSMDLKTLGKGLGAFALLLVGLALFSKIQGASATSAAQAVTILLLAIAIRTLADAVKLFGSMSWDELARGFAGLAGGLIAVGLALYFMPNGVSMILGAIGIAKVAGATLLIANAMKEYATIDWNTIAKGLTSLGVTMAILVLALNKMPKVGIGQAVGLLAVAFAIKIVSEAVMLLGNLDLGSAIQGIISIAAILGILVVALNLMQGTMAGAAAILLVAAALNILLPVITTLGAMPVGAIVLALAALAGVFIVLGVAAWALAPVTPVLMALGIAIALLGAAVFLAGAGVFLFALGLTALAAAGAAATTVLIAAVTGLLGLIPLAATQIGLGIVALLVAIGNSGAALTTAFVQIVGALLDAIVQLAPKIAQALLALIISGLHVLTQAIPRFVQAGFEIILGVLRGIANNIGRIVDVAADIVVNFINGLSRNIGRIIQAGVNFVISFVNGLADGIRNNSARMGEAGGNLATAMVEGMIRGLGGMAGRLISEAKKLAERAWNAAKDWLGISSPSKKFKELGAYSGEGMAIGLSNMSDTVGRSAENVGQSAIDGMKKTITGLGDLLGGDLDMRPVIAPVLDLTDVRAGAAGLGTLLEAKPLSVGASYSSATSASVGYRTNQAALEDDGISSEGDGFTFIQNNYSPKALSPAEVYRGTRSQLSVAKEALKTNAD